MNTATAVDQFPKSGRKLSILGSTWLQSPDSPPICGSLSVKYATANVPVIVMPNWNASVTSTPQSPETEAKKIVMTEQTIRVRSIGHPSTTVAILTAAKFTVAMMKQLKKSPR